RRKPEIFSRFPYIPRRSACILSAKIGRIRVNQRAIVVLNSSLINADVPRFHPREIRGELFFKGVRDSIGRYRLNTWPPITRITRKRERSVSACIGGSRLASIRVPRHYLPCPTILLVTADEVKLQDLYVKGVRTRRVFPRQRA